MRILVPAFAALLLSACSGNMKENLGLKHDGPDEFAVERKPKLEVPPSFKLRPPTPGEDPLNTVTPRDSAREALVGKPDADTVATPATDESNAVPLTGTPQGADDAAPAPAATDGANGASSGNAAAPLAATPPSEGENALLKGAGASEADPAIRGVLKKEYNEEQDKDVIDKLRSLSDDNFDKTVVDPTKEKARIDENKKEDKPITEGETPAKSINNDKSVIDKIFN